MVLRLFLGCMVVMLCIAVPVSAEKIESVYNDEVAQNILEEPYYDSKLQEKRIQSHILQFIALLSIGSLLSKLFLKSQSWVISGVVHMTILLVLIYYFIVIPYNRQIVMEQEWVFVGVSFILCFYSYQVVLFFKRRFDVQL